MILGVLLLGIHRVGCDQGLFDVSPDVADSFPCSNVIIGHIRGSIGHKICDVVHVRYMFRPSEFLHLLLWHN